MQAKKIKVLFVLFIFLLSSLSCRFLQLGDKNESTNSDIVQEVVTVAVSTLPVEENVQEEPSVIEETPAISDADVPVMDTSRSEAAAILVDQTHTDENGSLLLSVVDADGTMIAELQTPGIILAEQQRVHIAGGMPDGQFTAPLVYYSSENGGVIRQNINGNITDLANVPFLLSMVGVPGQPLVAYSTAELSGSGVHTALFVSSLQDMGSAAPVLEEDNTQSESVKSLAMAIKPLAVDMADGQAAGIWFTRENYGIGGADIIYWMQNSLYYYDMASGAVEEYLDDSWNPSGLSPDRTLVAYTVGDFKQDRPMTVGVLAAEVEEKTIFPLSPDHERGAGYAVFSPDNRRVAWMECGGSMMDASLHCVVKVGVMDGTVLYDSAISSAIGGGPVYWVQPMGWLDSDTVLVQIRRYDSDRPQLVKISMDNGSIAEVCEGNFIGLVYP